MSVSSIRTSRRPALAPEIFRKRLLMEGFFRREEVDEADLREYFRLITTTLALRTYAEPMVYRTAGQGKAENQGYDAFVPLIESGIYISVWSAPRFLSIVMYTCAEFDEERALSLTREFFELGESDALSF
jgi:hypothetical protein